MVGVAPDAYRPWPLGTQQKQRLARAIAACFGTLHELSRITPETIALRVPQADRLLTLAYNIIDTCASYPSGMENLVENLQYGREESEQLGNVFNVLQNIYIQPVSMDRTIFLCLTLEGANLSDDRCVALCAQSIPSGWPLPRIHPERRTLRSIVDWLARLGLIENNAAPIVRFAREAANLPDIPEKNRHVIKQWAEKIAGDLQPDEAATAKLGSRRTPQRHPLFLLVELEPTASAGGYIVQAWLAKGADINLRYTTSEPVALESMPGRFKEILQNIKSDLIQAQNDLTIEFVVPNDLLCHPVETWPNLVDDQIGLIYPVVVRARWRIRQDVYWPQWSKRWHCYPNGRALLRTRLQAATRQQLQEDLLEDGVLCLALPFLPEINPDARDDIVHAAVRFGIPIAVWLKSEPQDASASETELEKLLEGGLEDLRNRILRKRRQGDRLTLLWDDYTRLPDSDPDEEAVGLL